MSVEGGDRGAAARGEVRKGSAAAAAAVPRAPDTRDEEEEAADDDEGVEETVVEEEEAMDVRVRFDAADEARDDVALPMRRPGGCAAAERDGARRAAALADASTAAA